MVLLKADKPAPAGVKGTPSPFVRWSMNHGHQELQLLAGLVSAPFDARILLPGKALCLADQMGKASLVQVDPFPVDLP